MRRKVIIIMLLTAIIINSLTGSVAMASGIDDNATGGGSSSGLNSGNGTLNWSQTKSGYRFTVIDKAGNVMSLGENGKAGSVDVFFMNYKDIQNNLYYFTNAKTQSLSNNQLNKNLTIEELNKVAKFNSLPPYPISTDGNGNAKGEGQALKQWLMAGKKWIGKRTSSNTVNSSSTGNSSNTGGSNGTGTSNSTGNSNNTGNSKPSTPKYDVVKAKADIISSAKKLKKELDEDLKIDINTKRQTYYSWMSQLANYYRGLYTDKRITKEEYDEIILGTAMDMLQYMLNANFMRMLIISFPSDVIFSGVKSAIDKNLDAYIKNIDKLNTFNTNDKRRLLNYYVEGEKEYFKWLYDAGVLSKSAYSYANRYIEEVTKNKYKSYTFSSNTNVGKVVTMNMSNTDSIKVDNKGSMVQTLSYTRTEPVYLSAAPTPTTTKNKEEVTVVSLSTTGNSSSSTTEVEDKGEIIKLLNAEFKGKPLFELTEHNLPEYAAKSTVDIMVAKGYSLLVENLNYIQPATWDSAKGGAGTYFKYHIFGTITNYAECLTLLKSKGYWSDMSGGAYSTPTSKLGWSALMTESDWKGDGITIKAPTKTEGTRRAMDELASASNLSKGTIEGYGMQLYMTNPEESEEITEEEVTPTPVITKDDSGIILYENEITKVSSLLDSYEGVSSKLKIQSSISEVAGKNHTIYLHDNHGKDEEGNEIPCSGHLCKVAMKDNKYNHIYGISKLVDNNKIIAETESFASKLLDNSTGVSTIGLSGNDDIKVYPNYSFNLFRSSDVPTLADYKNSSDVVKDLKELGLMVSSGGADYQSDRVDTGSNSYSFDISLAKDNKSDTVTTYNHSLESKEGSQTHTLGEISHSVGVTVKTYTGDLNIGIESSDILADKFDIKGHTFINPSRYIIEPEDNIVFYPYIKMNYTIGNTTKDAYVLSKDMSVLKNSEFIEIGYSKTGKSSFNLLMESNLWNSHRRTSQFISENGIKDRRSVLPGGAVYSLQEQPKNTTYVGVRTWQTVIPDSELNHVANGADYYSSEKAYQRRNSLVEDINKNIEQYKLTQYIQQGIEKEQKKIIGDGTALNKIASGISQKVFENQLSKDAKYYLRSNVSTKEANSNAIFTAGDSNSQLVRTVEYKINSNTEGNVYLYKMVNNGAKEMIGQISKIQTAEDMIQQSEEIKELDDKTKLVTNYVSSIDRNQGTDKNNNPWYNEAFDGISVILSEYMIQVGFTDGNSTGASSRTSALDPKLCGLIESKSDIFNYSSDTAKDKIRSSCFAIYPTLSSKPKGYVAECNWGDTVVPIQIRNIEYLFLSKVFYIPNGTVMDIGR
ncbi:hypothetical protein [Anaerocolumna sp.]|uniref:hypothetical protein n=1 Tax=Anaerocolumna sp. TaxID=2041569 RepID=UPI0028A89CDD|nr:hypothetical protein [Anaerocolumna sp.]